MAGGSDGEKKGGVISTLHGSATGTFEYGSLFAGRVLSVIDELAFIACAQTYPEHNFVTRAIEDAAFIAPALLGDILEFSFSIESTGHTSLRVRVEMVVISGKSRKANKSFDGCVIMVCVNSAGKAVPMHG